jgi:hypothetical protein
MSDQPRPEARSQPSGVVWVPRGGSVEQFGVLPPKVRDNAERNKARIVAALTVISSSFALYDLVRMTLGY